MEVDATAFKYVPVEPSGFGVLVAMMIGALGAVAPPLAQVVPDPVGFGIVEVLPV